MDFDAAVLYMGSLIRFGWKLGNERMEALCERLGNPHRRCRVVHVAGTKGKGSTTALTAGILRAQGYRTGAYFSPYVYDVRERIQVDGEMIAQADFARLVTLSRSHIEALAETDLGQTTEFELKTVVAFLYFAERNVDFACIEVGIGGRLDATNVVAPVVTVITNIGLDHTDILGDTHEKIAAEKAGIIKPGVPCITAADHPGALATIEQIARERGSRLARVTRGSADCPTADPEAVHWDSAGVDEEFAPVSVATERSRYADLAMSMGGLYQRENAACAIAAAEIAVEAGGGRLHVSAAKTGLARTSLPGRLTVAHPEGGPWVVLDGAHNAMAAEALSSALTAWTNAHAIHRRILVIGMVGGHSPEGVLSALAPGVETVYACQPEWKRAQPAEAIAEAAREHCPDVRTIHSVREAVKAAVAQADAETLVLITGSFYTVGEIRPEEIEPLSRPPQ